ncbi:quinone-dependent dihydroorotate dehydrogenase [soil metagenome]
MISEMWQKLIRPVMFALDAERAHEFGIEALKLGFGGSDSPSSYDAFGEIERFGLKFANPLGLAAGFDKNGVVVKGLASLGFGFVEVGTVTYKPQPGNPKPRLFRLQADKALINRLGFNNDGAAAVADRLSKLDRKCIVGVNIGKNKYVPNDEATENYLKSFELVHPVADYIAVNISSPNTPNLRELQRAENLDELLGALQQRNRVLSSNFSWQNEPKRPTEVGTQSGKPLLVKIAPDLGEGEIEAIVEIAIKYELSGIIATNTTISRDGLTTEEVESIGAGGVSGRPLTERSTEVISTIYRYSNGKLPIIGVGGIFSAEDAFAKIAAGASLIQAYTGFVYGGPAFAEIINNGLAAMISERGFGSLDEAVGSNSRN